MTSAMTHCAMRFGLTLSALALAGCSLRPAHAPDTGPIPPAYKHARAESAGSWTTAQPADDALRGDWWTLFQDPALNALQSAAQDANPTLQAAYARLQLSRAQHKRAQSALFPRLDAGFGPTRQRESPASYSERDDGPASTRTLWRAEAAVAYEADLFGRVSSTISAASAEQARSGALYRLTLLALQADVADTYFLIRELDTQHRIYQQTLALRERGFALSQMRFEAGDGGELELERARGELEAARADALGAQRLRA
ncbi:TolC family protein, partial [Achromobacter sp.]|uniref:TolC family protein n=1 Tax=Achromobacter sp. TaxID=134375 RepID=UPI002F924E1E